MALDEASYLLNATIQPVSLDYEVGILKLVTNTGTFEVAINRDGAEGLATLLVAFLENGDAVDDLDEEPPAN